MQLTVCYSQQTEVLRELYMYLHPGPGVPIPHDRESVQQTHNYLQACNLLFEQGFLAHTKIWDMTSPVLTNIWQGYDFFVQWYNALEGNILLDIKIV